MDDTTPLMVPNSTVGGRVTDHDMTCAPCRTPRPSRWALSLRALSIPGLLRKLNLGQANSTGVARENNLVGTQNDSGYHSDCLLNGIKFHVTSSCVLSDSNQDVNATSRGLRTKSNCRLHANPGLHSRSQLRVIVNAALFLFVSDIESVPSWCVILVVVPRIR